MDHFHFGNSFQALQSPTFREFSITHTLPFRTFWWLCPSLWFISLYPLPLIPNVKGGLYILYMCCFSAFLLWWVAMKDVDWYTDKLVCLHQVFISWLIICAEVKKQIVIRFFFLQRWRERHQNFVQNWESLRPEDWKKPNTLIPRSFLPQRKTYQWWTIAGVTVQNNCDARFFAPRSSLILRNLSFPCFWCKIFFSFAGFADAKLEDLEEFLANKKNMWTFIKNL